MAELMELWAPAPAKAANTATRPPMRGSRVVPYAPFEGEGNIVAITRMAAYETQSFEELRMEDLATQPLVHAPQTLEKRNPMTLLERDALRAVGDVVLNEPHWWVHLHDNSKWKLNKHAIAMRVTRGRLQDAAAHVLNWMAPFAREIAETAKPEDRKLSLLVDKWPAEFADRTRDGSGVDGHATLPSAAHETRFLLDTNPDQYLVFAWAMLRRICKDEAMPWPVGWGATPCPCWILRPLVDAIVDRCIHQLETLMLRREDGLDVLYEDVQTSLLAGDDSATRWLENMLLESVAAIRFDIATVEMWTTRHLLSLIQDHQLTRGSMTTAVAVPAPFTSAFLIDTVDLTVPTNSTAAHQANPTVVEFDPALDDSTTKLTVATCADPGAQCLGLDLGALLGSLLPAFKKTHAATTASTSPIVEDQGTSRVKPSWLPTSILPQLLVGRKSLSPSIEPTIVSWKPSRVIVDTQTFSIPAHSPPFGPSGWNFNASVQAMDCVEIDATAVVCIQQTNVSAPELEIQSQSAREELVFPSTSEERYVRAAQVSSCNETTAGAVRVSAFPGRALVFPPATQYRVAEASRVDESQPGSFVLLRIAVVSPQCTTPTHTIQEKPKQVLNIPEWLEYLHLKAQDESLSVEEKRLAHYQRDRQRHIPLPDPVSLSHWFESVQKFPSEPPVRPKPHILERKVHCMITELTNYPQWWETQWLAGSTPRGDWELKFENFYLCERLQTSVAEGYSTMVANLGAQAAETANTAESKSDDENTAIDDGDGDRSDAFAQVGQLCSHFVMLREVYNVFAAKTTSKARSGTVEAVVDLVQRCRTAESFEAQAQIIGDFIHPGYSVAKLLSPVAAAWVRINQDVESWMKRVVAVVEAMRLRLEDAIGVYSPTEGTCVLDGAVDRGVKAMLMKALEPLQTQALDTPTGSSTHRLVDPTCSVQVLEQSVSTFSVPRTGSIDSRLAAIMSQTAGGGLSGQRFHQCVPSDVLVGLDGNARFLSYISNVTPRAHPSLYKSVDAITTACVPLFEALQSTLVGPTSDPLFWDGEGNLVKDEPLPSDPDSKARTTCQLRGRVVQIAVEIVQIDLNVDTPRFNGHEWYRNTTNHLPDDSAHDIIATGVYFAAVDNVTRPRISFRRVSATVPPFGFVNGYTDRCVVFSNEFVHKMEPFELVDKTRSGTVVMVQLHLVDPTVPTVSTANMQPSQREWAVEYTLGDLCRFFQLPYEVHDVIESMLQWEGVPEAELRATQPLTAMAC